MAKLSDDDILASRRATASDPKSAAALRFARVINETRGSVSDEDVRRVRTAGYDDGEIAEIVAHVALNVLTNYFNKVTDVEVDFPSVEPTEAAA